MAFQIPLALWLLLLIPVLLLILPFITKPRPLVFVPYLPLWAELDKVIPKKRIIRIIPFLIDIILLSAVIFALSGPVTGKAENIPSILILLDNSASMGAIDQGQSRLDHAKRLVGVKSQGYKASVVLLCPEPHVISTADISGVSPDITSGDPYKGLRMALDIASVYNDKILVLTDGAGNLWKEAIDSSKKEAGDRLSVEIIGKKMENASISNVKVTSKIGYPHILEITLANYTWTNRVFIVHVSLNGELYTSFNIEVPLREHNVYRALVNAPYGGNVKIDLEFPDALDADNHVSFALPVSRKAKVALVSRKEQPHLTAALSVFPSIIDEAESFLVEPESLDKILPKDLVIFTDDPPVSPLPAGTYVFFGTRGEFVPFAVTGETKTAIGWRILPDHPITKGLDLSYLSLKKHWTVDISGKNVPIAWSNQGPLMVVREQGESRYLYLTFRIEDTQFTALESFPLFIKNTVLWSLSASSENVFFPYVIQDCESDLSPAVSSGGPELKPLPLPPETRYWRYYLVLLALVIALVQGLWVYRGRKI